MAFLIKKEYGIETGTYKAIEGDKQIVVLDVVNHCWHRSKKLHQAIADPFVVYRDLILISTHHSRMMMRLTEFKQNFIKE
jgi:hypothetical protein